MGSPDLKWIKLHSLIDLLLRYGYLILFLNVLAEQVGLPVPAVPMLLAMGMLAGMNKMSILACLSWPRWLACWAIASGMNWDADADTPFSTSFAACRWSPIRV